MISAVRIGAAPIIHAGLCESLGDNINGPTRAGAVDFVNELRDPEIFEDASGVWMVYAGGREAAPWLARLEGD